jgi:hypothetical protein
MSKYKIKDTDSLIIVGIKVLYLNLPITDITHISKLRSKGKKEENDIVMWIST